MDKDGYISNGELFQVLKMMVGNNLKDTQLQQIVDKTIINADKDGDGRISFEEFCAVSTTALIACYSIKEGFRKILSREFLNTSLPLSSPLLLILFSRGTREIVQW